MKNILIAFFAVLIFNGYAQTLTQSFNEPIVGDTDKTYPIDTSGFSSGMPTALSGSNCVWNFTQLKSSGSAFPNVYVSASAVSGSSNYPGCNLVLKQGPINNFYKSTTTPTTQTELLGFNTGTLALTFTNSALVAKYPMSFGSTITDNIAGTFVFTVNGTCSGGLNTLADGLGTLQLPNGLSLSNVLRVKSTQTLNLSAVLSTLVPVPLQIGTIKQTSFYYFHSSSKFPVLNITYQSLSLITSTTPTITAAVSGNARVMILGLNEKKLNQSSFNIYPNPFNGVFIVDAAPDFVKDISIYDETCHLIFKVNEAREIDLTNFAHGIYFIEIQTKEGNVRKKIIKE